MEERSRMRAFILAAGSGSRLHPYTENAPKGLTELGGETLIGRQIDTLRAVGIDDIVIITGYLSEMLALPGTRQVNNERWAKTNMVESLFCAEPLFSDDILVSYSDIVYEPRVLEALLSSAHDISVVVDRKWRTYWELRFDDPLSDAESLSLNNEGCITGIGAPVTDISVIEAQYIGLMRFSRGGIDVLKRTRGLLGNVDRDWMAVRPLEMAYMTDLLMEMILRGEKVHAVPVDSGWLEIDTVQDYEDAARMFADSTIVQFFDPAA